MFNHVWWFFSLSLCFLLFVVATIPTTNKTNRRRYKILCANAIKEPCDPQKATQLILDAINLEPELYRMGNTKVLDAFGLLWNGVAVALYIIHRRKLSILQLFFSSNFFFFLFWYSNKISNINSLSLFLCSRVIKNRNWKRWKGFDWRIESFLLIHAARWSHDRYAYFSLAILRRREVTFASLLLISRIILSSRIVIVF